MDKKDKKKQLKMPVRTSATSQKAAGKTANAEAFVDLKPAKVGINPKLLCVSSVNYFRPGWAKASVAPKDSLSDKEFKDMNVLHDNTIVAIEKAHKLRLTKAAKEAEESKKLEAERKQNVKPKYTFENFTSAEIVPAFAAMKVAILATKVK